MPEHEAKQWRSRSSYIRVIHYDNPTNASSVFRILVSAATMLLQMNIAPKVVQEILGHTTVKMTMEIYGHVFPPKHDEAMDKMNDFLVSSAP